MARITMSVFEHPPWCRFGLTLVGEVIVLFVSTVTPCMFPALAGGVNVSIEPIV